MVSNDFSLKVKFYGTRGSIPVCAREFQTFGGNTTCLSVEVPDKNILSVIDAGSGIRILGKDLMREENHLPKDITIGFSHFHWDHIQGFPFFEPAYVPDVNINILMLGENWDISKLKDIMDKQMGGHYFPIAMEEMGAQFNFLSFGRRVHQRRSGMSVISRPHNHPGGAHSFRMEREGKVLVFVTDIEHGDTIDEGTIELARNADLLIHDAQFTKEQLEKKIGWGHSSYEQAIEVARRAEVKHLVMTHHDPDHDDEFLAAIEKKCQREFPDCQLAREGMEVWL